MQVADRDPDRVRVVCESRVDVAGEVRLHPADAERDPTVGCRAHVMERRSVVREPDPARPVDRLEPLGRRCREHDVGAPDGDRALEALPVLGPGVHREHRSAGLDRAARRLRDGGRAGAEPAHRGRLVDPHALREDRVPQAACEPGGLHARAVPRVDAAPQDGRVDPGAHLVGSEHLQVVEPEPVRRDHVVGPLADLRGAGRRGELAVGAEPGVESLRLAERPDRLDAVLAGSAEPECGIVAEPLAQGREVSPERVDEPAVAPARPAAADVLLEQHHIDVRIEFLQEPGGPHAGEAAAEDHDVGARVAVEPRALIAGERREREGLTEPPAAPLVGWDLDRRHRSDVAVRALGWAGDPGGSRVYGEASRRFS